MGYLEWIRINFHLKLVNTVQFPPLDNVENLPCTPAIICLPIYDSHLRHRAGEFQVRAASRPARTVVWPRQAAGVTRLCFWCSKSFVAVSGTMPSHLLTVAPLSVSAAAD